MIFLSITIINITIIIIIIIIIIINNNLTSSLLHVHLRTHRSAAAWETADSDRGKRWVR